jgi:hypothetical protein
VAVQLLAVTSVSMSSPGRAAAVLLNVALLELPLVLAVAAVPAPVAAAVLAAVVGLLGMYRCTGGPECSLVFAAAGKFRGSLSLSKMLRAACVATAVAAAAAAVVAAVAAGAAAVPVIVAAALFVAAKAGAAKLAVVELVVEVCCASPLAAAAPAVWCNYAQYNDM